MARKKKDERHPLEKAGEEQARAAKDQREALQKKVEDGEGVFDAYGRYYVDGVNVTNYLPADKKKLASIREASKENEVEDEPAPVITDNTDKGTGNSNAQALV